MSECISEVCTTDGREIKSERDRDRERGNLCGWGSEYFIIFFLSLIKQVIASRPLTRWLCSNWRHGRLCVVCVCVCVCVRERDREIER